MKLYSNEDAGVERSRTCCSLDDVEDARSVAHRLGIPYYVFNFSGDFRREVMERFVCAYEAGETPNPCIDCNRHSSSTACITAPKSWGVTAWSRVTMRGSSGRGSGFC
jgi:tRNA U34 2-thiouridine synthase MnmA/TrmU